MTDNPSGQVRHRNGPEPGEYWPAIHPAVDYPADDYEGAERQLERDAIRTAEDPALRLRAVGPWREVPTDAQP